MLNEVFLNLYVMATGFVTAGVLASSVQLVTGRPLGFSMAQTGFSPMALLGVMTRVIAGPVILLRNAIRGRKIQGRAVHWIFMSTIIAATWSFFSGVLVIETLIRLSIAI